MFLRCSSENYELWPEYSFWWIWVRFEGSIMFSGMCRVEWCAWIGRWKSVASPAGVKNSAAAWFYFHFCGCSDVWTSNPRPVICFGEFKELFWSFWWPWELRNAISGDGRGDNGEITVCNPDLSEMVTLSHPGFKTCSFYPMFCKTYTFDPTTKFWKLYNLNLLYFNFQNCF